MNTTHLLMAVMLLVLPLATASLTIEDSTATIKDTIIYTTTHYHNGQNWQKITLNEETQWTTQTATTNLPDNAQQFAYYSCSWEDGWQCPNNWKIRNLNTEETTTADITVPTLHHALNLTNVSIGTTIQTQGRDEPGDGGGGLFNVTNSGCETDGGTCFIFDEDLSAEQTETITINLPALDIALPHADLSWRKTRVRYGPDSNDFIGMEYLHGAGNNYDGVVDRKDGSIGPWSGFDSLREEFGYDSQKWHVKYKHATSDRRLERQNVGNGVNIAWWGAPRADPETPTSAVQEISWAANTAANIYDDGSYNWTYVDIPGEYYMLHAIEIPSGVKLRGVGEVNDDGFTRGGITWIPGEIMYHQRKDYTFANDTDRQRIHAAAGRKGGRTTARIKQAKGASKIGVEQVRLDGNVDDNMQVFDNREEYESVGSYLQNSGGWNGVYVRNYYEDGMTIDLDDVHVVDVAGNGLASASTLDGGVPDWDTDNVHVDTAYRNHLIYALQGGVSDITLEGTFWGGNPLSSAAGPSANYSYQNLTVKNLEANPDYIWGGIFADRAGDTTVDGFTVDLASSTSDDHPTGVTIFTADDQGTTIKNGQVTTWYQANASSSGLSLFSQRSTSQDHVGPHRLQNITITDYGFPISLVGGSNFGRLQNAVLQDITVRGASGINGVANTTPFTLVLDNRLEDDVAKARRLELRDVKYERPFESRYPFDSAFRFGNSKLLGYPLPDDIGWQLPIDIYAEDSVLNNTGDNIVSHQFPRPKKWVATRLYFDNLTHPVQGATFHKHLRPDFHGGVTHLRNSQDGEGRVSDNTGRYVSNQEDVGNDYVLIETDLMSRPWERKAEVIDGGYTVESVEIANADGSLREDDNTGQEDPYLKITLDDTITAEEPVTIDWTARVTPLQDYRTEGLFVAREVPMQNLTSQDTKTIDLRGVASSQVSREKIIYTATSTSPNIVTANVKDDEYTLELQRQGTGTANVTVTGAIAGVGSVSESFAVTVG